MGSRRNEKASAKVPGARSTGGFGGWLALLWAFVCAMSAWHFMSLIGDGSDLRAMFESPDNAAAMRGILWFKVWLWAPFLILAPLGHPLLRTSAVFAAVTIAIGEGWAVMHLLELSVVKIVSINVFNVATAALLCAYLVFSRRVASLAAAPRKTDARARHHFLLFLLVMGGVTVTVFTGDIEHPADVVSMLTAWQFLLLLVVVLSIGPYRVLRYGRVRQNSYQRRDIGIWVGVAGLMHLVAGTAESMTPQYVAAYVESAVAIDPAVAMQVFSWATIVGLLIGLLVLGLLALSNDSALRRLGVSWWKRLHRLSYLVFFLTVAHAFAFQWLESRDSWLAILTGGLAAWVVVVQLTGFVAVRRRRRRARIRRLNSLRDDAPRVR